MTTETYVDILSPQSDPVMQRRLQGIVRSRDDWVALLDHAPVDIPEHGLLAGTVAADRTAAGNALGHDPRPGIDNCHFPMHPGFLQLGFAGIVARAAVPRSNLTNEQNLYRSSIVRVFQAACRYVQRHERSSTN